MSLKSRYWSELPVLLPGTYKTRTRLTDRYILQASGLEGTRYHRVTLYALMVTGYMKNVWSRRLPATAPMNMDEARAAAIKAAYDMLRDRKTRLARPVCSGNPNAELEAVLEDAANEIEQNT